MDKNEQPKRINEVDVKEQIEIRERSYNYNNYMLPASILVAGLLVSGSIIYLVKSNNSVGNGAVAQAPSQNQGQQANVGSADSLKLTSNDVVLGSQSAPVTVVEYGDYQCPFCGKFFTDIEPQLKKDYIDTGKVKFVFRDFIVNDRTSQDHESHWSAEAVQCAKDQNEFWQFHDAIYSAETKDGIENNGNLNRAFFVQTATNLGMKLNQFEQCFDSGKYAAAVQKESNDVAASGVNATPTSFVNGQMIQGAVPYIQFAAAINSALKGK
ncbi:MAG: DsbA family protein [Patescibacteria group bacterium]|nr:DsbA family protein [Patescibacteria group bacterium]MDE2015290.1 DsbA family protein [Patescibacteria group bacterium]MDE2227096.1 DsbA family protein [Patescibacteria group bacterium]